MTHRHISLIGLDAQCQHPSLTSNYLDNLERLGIINVETMVRMQDDNFYKRVEDHAQIKGIIDNLNKSEERRAEVDKMRVSVTDLGKQFIRACVVNKDEQPRS